MVSEVHIEVSLKAAITEPALSRMCADLEAFAAAASGNVVHSWTGNGTRIEVYVEVDDAKKFIKRAEIRLAEIGLADQSRVVWAENFEED